MTSSKCSITMNLGAGGSFGVLKEERGHMGSMGGYK